MDVSSAIELASIGLSLTAFVVALIKNKGKKNKTVQEKAKDVNQKIEKFTNKQCKKNKIEISDLVNDTEETKE